MYGTFRARGGIYHHGFAHRKCQVGVTKQREHGELRKLESCLTIEYIVKYSTTSTSIRIRTPSVNIVELSAGSKVYCAMRGLLFQIHVVWTQIPFVGSCWHTNAEFWPFVTLRFVFTMDERNLNV